MTVTDRTGGLLAKVFDLGTLAFLAAILGRILSDPTRINHDSASLLMGAVMVHEGRMPIAALFAAMNPPVVSYANVLVVETAVAIGTNVIFVYLLATWAAVAVSTLAVRSLLAKGGLLPAGAAAFAACVWAWTSFALFEQSDANFGQREHLLVLLLAPFLLAIWLCFEDVSLSPAASIAFGVVAGLATCAKPHYALAPALTVAVLLLSHRRIRPLLSPGVAAYVLTGAVFVGHLFLLPSEFSGAFLRVITSTARGYDVYNQPWPVLFREVSVRFALFVGTVALALAAFRRGPAFRLIGGVGASALAAAGIYLFQRKGWSYHAVPAFGLGALTAALVVASPLAFWRFVARPFDPASSGVETLRRAVLRVSQAAALVAVALALTSAAPLVRNGIGAAPASQFERTFAELSRPKEEVLFVTTSVWPIYPALLRLDRRPFHRYWGPMMNIAFYQAGLAAGPEGFPYRSWPEMSAEERTFLEALGREIRTGRPSLIVVAAGPAHQGCPEGFVLEEYLRRAPPVAEALAGYAPVARLWKHLYLKPTGSR